MSDNLSDRLQRAADRFVAASLERGFIYGTVGRQNENGSYSVVVAGRPNYLYVTVDGEQASTIARAENTQRKAGLPVKMKYEGGELVIKGVNPLAEGAFLEGGAGGSVAFHNHNEHSGLEYAINSTRLKQGRVRFVTALTVHIGEFAYSHLGDWRWWPGGNIDLTALKPAGAGTWAWVLVGIDPSTNAAVAVAGASQATGVELTVDQIESIAFNGHIPCGAVRVRADDTALNLASRYADARIWLDRLGASGGGDVAAEIDGATEKTTPVGADKLGLVESEAPDAGVLKWLSWTNLVAGVQAAIDSVYFRLAGRAGGQVAHGGTDSGETLTLRGSAHATSGGVVVDDTFRQFAGAVTGLFGLMLGSRGGGTGLKVANTNTNNHVGIFLGETDDISATPAGQYRFGSTHSSQPGVYNLGTFENAAGAHVLIHARGLVRIFIADDGRVALGAAAPATSCALQLPDAGALRVPRLTTAQRDALTASNGMIILNATTGQFQGRASGAWVNLH